MISGISVYKPYRALTLLAAADIDECAERLDNCTRSQGQLCQNTDGGFNCIVRCEAGLRFSAAQGGCAGPCRNVTKHRV